MLPSLRFFATGAAALVAAGLLLAACQSTRSRADDDAMVVARALHQANSRVTPAIGRSVTYDTGARVLKIVFDTPSTYRIDFTRFWARWRTNQAAALAVFDAAELEVEVVTVETNHTDGSGRVRARTPADAVRAYGTGPSDEPWRRASLIEQQKVGQARWEPVQ